MDFFTPKDTTFSFSQSDSFVSFQSQSPSRSLLPPNKTSFNNSADSAHEEEARSDRCVPVTVSLLQQCLSSKSSSSSENTHFQTPQGFRVHGYLTGLVSLCGWVTLSQKLSSRLIFYLADGSGKIAISYSLDAGENTTRGGSEDEEEGRKEESYMPKVGKIYRVVGAPVATVGKGMRSSAFDGPYVEATSFRQCVDMNEYVCFSDMEVIFTAMKMLKTTKKDKNEGKPGREQELLERCLEWCKLEVPIGYQHLESAIEQNLVKILSQQQNKMMGKEKLIGIMSEIHSKAEAVAVIKLLQENEEIVCTENLCKLVL